MRNMPAQPGSSEGQRRHRGLSPALTVSHVVVLMKETIHVAAVSELLAGQSKAGGGSTFLDSHAAKA